MRGNVNLARTRANPTNATQPDAHLIGGISVGASLSGAALIGATVIVATLLCASPVSAQYGALDGEWRVYGGDGGHTQYTALDQIDADNVGDLEVAWRWTAANSSGPDFYNFESTPIMIGGVLYTTTGAS